jgi:O-acetyl-ADP-ribose deacetylase (regulator of RNase III)
VQHVIHAVGPVYHDRTVSAPPLLAAAHAYALALARFHGVQRIAFPAISCGVFGYPHHAAAALATRTIARHSAGLREVVVVIADRAYLGTWRDAARRMAVAADLPGDPARPDAGEGA